MEPVGVPGDSDWVSVPGVAVLGAWASEPGDPPLGVWDSEPGEPVLGVWDSEPGEPAARSLGLGAGLGARRKSEHPSQSSNA